MKRELDKDIKNNEEKEAEFVKQVVRENRTESCLILTLNKTKLSKLFQPHFAHLFVLR